MIQNYSYSYPDFKKMLPNLIETFVEYYGEEYRAYITDKLNSVDVHFFTGIESIDAYIDEKLPVVREDIINEFLDEFGVKKEDRDRVRKALFTMDDRDKTTAIGEYSKLSLASLTTRSDYATLFDKDRVASIERYRKEILKSFRFTGSPAMADLFLEQLETKRQECMEKLEGRLGEVGKDSFAIDYAEKDALYEYYKYISKYYKFSESDLKKIHMGKLPVYDTIECKDLFCKNSSVALSGNMYLFTSTVNKKLRNKKDTLTRSHVYTGRIEYFKSRGLRLPDIEGEDIEDTYARYLKNGGKKLIIPSRVADKIERRRMELSEGLYDGVTYVKYFDSIKGDYVSPMSIERYIDNVPNNYELNYIKVGKNYVPRGVVCLDCNVGIHPDDILSNLIHELGHHIQVHILDIDSKNKEVTTKESIEKEDVFAIGYVSEPYDVYSEDEEENGSVGGVANVIEYFNEMQAMDMTKLYLSKYKNPFTVSDISAPTKPFSSLYQKADFLLGDIWRGHRDAIKHECISGKSTFSVPFGYARLEELNTIIGDFYRDDVSMDVGFCSHVYDGVDYSKLRPQTRGKLDKYKKLVVETINAYILD